MIHCLVVPSAKNYFQNIWPPANSWSFMKHQNVYEIFRSDCNLVRSRVIEWRIFECHSLIDPKNSTYHIFHPKGILNGHGLEVAQVQFSIDTPPQDSQEQKRTFHLFRFIVHENFRNRGFGTLLVDLMCVDIELDLKLSKENNQVKMNAYLHDTNIEVVEFLQTRFTKFGHGLKILQ